MVAPAPSPPNARALRMGSDSGPVHLLGVLGGAFPGSLRACRVRCFTLAVFSCKKYVKIIYEKYCSIFRLYMVNIILS